MYCLYFLGTQLTHNAVLVLYVIRRIIQLYNKS